MHPPAAAWRRRRRRGKKSIKKCRRAGEKGV